VSATRPNVQLRPRIAVSGASGFVGRYVVDALQRRDVEVIALTRKPERLRGFGGAVRVVEFDIAAASADAYEQLGCPDALVHLAWDGLSNYLSPRHFEKELPQHYLFLKSLVEAGLPSLLAVGTCFEYGMQSGSLVESLDPRPVTSYGYAKDALRRQLEFLRAQSRFSLTWARLFYMHGEGQLATSLLPMLRDAVARGQQTFDMSGGEQLRDYLPVAEVAKCLVDLLLLCPDSGIVNVCSGAPVSVRRLVDTWIAENGWNIVPNLGVYPYPDYEPLAFWGNSTKLSKLLGDAPHLPECEPGALQ
jgi:dTDP-6-deoxy-L-talose 4-dehydrogenase (NAD+)